MKQLKEQLLKETVNFYNAENRSVSGEYVCVYENITNKHCAIGRILTKTALKNIKNKGYNSGTGVEELNDLIPLKTILVKKYKPLYKSIRFLGSIQLLHDRVSNWTDKGISDTGKKEVKQICKRFKLNSKKVLTK